jgi:hypothetical protein
VKVSLAGCGWEIAIYVRTVLEEEFSDINVFSEDGVVQNCSERSSDSVHISFRVDESADNVETPRTGCNV